MEEVGSAWFICVNSTADCEQDGVFFFVFPQLCTARSLLRSSIPVLLRLNEKAAAALKERDQCVLARDQAVEDREQV